MGSVSRDALSRETLEYAAQEARILHQGNDGYVGIWEGMSLQAEDGQNFIQVAVKPDGDCCLHALGTTRSAYLQQVGSFIEDGEKSWQQHGMAERVRDAQTASEVCAVLLSTATAKDLVAFRGHDLAGWKAKLARTTQGKMSPEQTLAMCAVFDSLLPQKASPEPDWPEVLRQATHLSRLVGSSVTGDVALAISYDEWAGKCTADIATKLGDNQRLAALSAYLQKQGVLDAHGKKCRCVFEADFPLLVSGDGKKFVKYVQHMVDFPTADGARRKAIVNDFYGAEKEWIDPSSIMHWAKRIGIKAKLYKKVGNRVLFRAKTHDDDVAGLPCRTVVHVNENHFDILHPISLARPPPPPASKRSTFTLLDFVSTATKPKKTRGVASLSRDTLPREAKEVAVYVCVRVLACPLSL